MSDNNKLILKKLVALAEKQQKILVKLAQATQDNSQANIEYLKGAWTTAALNTGFPGATPTVQYTPGNQQPDGVTIEGNYMVTGEVPANAREKFLRTFKAQIVAQKPELDGKVSTIFKDPTTPQPV